MVEMELLREAVAHSTSGTRLISLLLAADRDKEEVARAIVDVLHDAGVLPVLYPLPASSTTSRRELPVGVGTGAQQGAAASQTLEEPISSLELICLAPR